ncbi:MAG TPA: multicopper oxidase domain-containing protein [Spirochaetia bacterium]|nr:multicopper oxidase domain-containing protein [Spirochaetia bacterium]
MTTTGASTARGAARERRRSGLGKGRRNAWLVLTVKASRKAREPAVTFRAGWPGTYYYLCQYDDHASKGMYGKLIVAAK